MDAFLSTSFLNSIGEIVLEFPIISYTILAIGFVVRGELAMLLSAFLVVNSYLSFSTFILLVFVGLMIGDNLTYAIGRFLRNTRFSTYIEKKFSFTQKYQDYFKRNFTKLIFLSKFTIGLTLVIMLSSGWSRVKFKRFFIAHLFATAVWFIVMGSISFFLMMGLGYLQTAEIFDKIEIALLVIVLLIFGAEYFIKKLIKKGSFIENRAINIGDAVKKIIKSRTREGG